MDQYEKDLRDGGRREGVRGGLEQFRWDPIKEEKYIDREQYLGVSVKVGILGKLGKYNKNDWWQKGRGEEGEEGEERGEKKGEKGEKKGEDEEKKILRLYEQELMQEGLGLKPQRLMLEKGALTIAEKKRLLEEGGVSLDFKERKKKSKKRKRDDSSSSDEEKKKKKKKKNK